MLGGISGTCSLSVLTWTHTKNTESNQGYASSNQGTDMVRKRGFLAEYQGKEKHPPSLFQAKFLWGGRDMQYKI